MTLVLGGGAARGLAHLGVLRVLEREGVRPGLILGTSMGAILGASYAAEPNADALIENVGRWLASDRVQELREQFLKESKSRRGGLLYSVKNLVRRGVAYGGSTLSPLISMEAFAESLTMLLPDADMDSLKIPFRAVALDINTGEEVVMAKGDLRQACLASSAIPGLLTSVQRNGRELVDGGWIDKVPVLPARALGGDPVVAVDITAELEETDGPLEGLAQYVRANDIRDARLIAWTLHGADVALEPAVKDVHWADFGAFEQCIEAGEASARGALPALERAMTRANQRRWWPPSRKRRLRRARALVTGLGVRWE
jgi:NTE family protein